MKTKDVTLKAFAEGVEIPITGISRSQQSGGQFQFGITVPPTLLSFRVLPRTIIQVFILETEAGITKSKLMAEGLVTNRSYSVDIHGRKQVSFDCLGYDSVWSQARVGMDMGDGTNATRGLLHQMFAGLSGGATGSVDILPGQSQVLGKYLAFLRDAESAKDAKFLSIDFFLKEFMQRYGPITGLIRTLANLSSASPIFKQLYNAIRIVERIIYRENFKVANLVAQSAVLQSLFSYINQMSSEATFMDVLQTILQETEHQYIFMPSPYFLKEALTDANEFEETAFEYQEIVSLAVAEYGSGVGMSGWIWPIASGTSGGRTISSGIGRRSSPGQYASTDHKGTDIAIPVGTPIMASAAGIARRGFQRNHAGNFVAIRHPNGWVTKYMHLSSINIQTGQSVSQGQVIGLSGGKKGAPGSGSSTGPHLHFEMRDPSDNAKNSVQIILGGDLNYVDSPRTADSHDSYTSPSFEPATSPRPKRVRGGAFGELTQVARGNFYPDITADLRAGYPAGNSGNSAAAPPEAAQDFTPTMANAESSCEDLLKDPRVRALLDVIRAVEVDPALLSNPRRPINQNDTSLYRTSYGGRRWPNLTVHPGEEARVFVSRLNDTTSAVGAYQFQEHVWNEATTRLNRREGTSIHTMMPPYNQEMVAVSLMKYVRTGSLQNLFNGSIAGAIRLLHQEWEGLTRNDSPIPLKELYSIRLSLWTNGLSGDYMSPSWAGMTEEQRSASLQQQIDFNVSDYEESTPIEGALRQMLFLPRFHFSPPPTCNVFFPDRLSNLQVGENFYQSPTRIMMLADPIGRYASGGNLYGNDVSAYFSPRHIQGVFDVLRGDNPVGGLLGDDDKSQMQILLKDYVKMVEELKARGIDPEESTDTPEYINAIYESMSSSVGSMSKEDLLSSVIDGDTELPDNMLGINTYDELFRGVIPMVTRFPFKVGQIESGGPTPDEEGEESEETTEEVAATESTGEYWASRTNSKSIVTRLQVEAAAQVANTDEDLPDEVEYVTENDLINFYNNYRFAVMKQEARTASFQIPFTLDVACGFQGAIYDTAIGWIVGEIISVSDTVDTQSKAAITQVNMKGCRFLGDYEDPTWARIHAEADAEACHLSEDGVSENPLLFDDDFSPGLIGNEIYQPMLGVPSVMDWAIKNKGSEPVPSTLRKALDIIAKRYTEAGDGNLSSSEWARNFTERPIATEENLMTDLLEAPTDEYGYSGTYTAWTMPGVVKTPFMAERRNWAKNYVNSIKRESFTHSVNKK